MKKRYSTGPHRKRQLRLAARANRKLQQLNRSRILNPRKPAKGRIRAQGKRRKPITAPADLRLIENPEACLSFFRDLRNDSNLIRGAKELYVDMSLRKVTKIDYGTISILTALNDHFRWKDVTMRTRLPQHETSRQYLFEAGYQNNLFDQFGRPFAKAEASDLIFFEKGSGKLTDSDSRKISQLVLNVLQHLGGDRSYLQAVRTVILEICGNSIEWSGTKSKQWLLGAKYEERKVIFTVTDVGVGILTTLHSQYSSQILEMFRLRDSSSILMRAFEKKYGSSSQETNRNKGLPAIKWRFERGVIQGLKVLTNDVILDFSDAAAGRTFERRSARFKGTFYQWTMSADSLKRIEAGDYDNN